MIKSHTIKLRLNNNIRNILDQYLGYPRYLYNKLLTEYTNQYKISKHIMSWSEMTLYLRQTRLPWELDFPAILIDSAVNRFRVALDRFKSRVSRFPVYKSKNKTKDSFTIHTSKSYATSYTNPDRTKVKFPLSYKHNSILTSDQKWINLSEQIRFTGNIKTLTFYKEYNRYFVTIVTNLSDQDIFDNYILPDMKDILTKRNELIGLDLGIKSFTHDNYNTSYIFLNTYLNYLYDKYKHYQVILSRKYNKNSLIQSKNYIKTKKKSDNVLFKINNLKEDSLRKLVRFYYKYFKYIALEDLSKSKLSNKKHNKSKSLRSNLQKVPFYKLRQYLKEKFQDNLIIIPKYYPSTKTCSNCNNIQNIKLNQRVYNCKSCNIILDRDFNAAINIAKSGLNIIKNQGGLRPSLVNINIDYNDPNIIINYLNIQNLLNK